MTKVTLHDVHDMLGGFNDGHVRVAVEGRPVGELVNWLRLMKGGEGGLRLCKKAGDNVFDPWDRFILVDEARVEALTTKDDCTILAMETHGLIAFDDAGVMHVTEKGRELCGKEGGER